MWQSHETIYMQFANSVKLQLKLRDFYNLLFKIQHTFYIASVSVPLPPWRNLGAHLNVDDLGNFAVSYMFLNMGQ